MKKGIEYSQHTLQMLYMWWPFMNASTLRYFSRQHISQIKGEDIKGRYQQSLLQVLQLIRRAGADRWFCSDLQKKCCWGWRRLSDLTQHCVGALAASLELLVQKQQNEPASILRDSLSAQPRRNLRGAPNCQKPSPGAGLSASEETLCIETFRLWAGRQCGKWRQSW